MSTYPASLPEPSAFPFSPRERRAASPQDGPPELRGRSREQLVDARGVQWIYSPAQMAVWLDWYQNDLQRGQLWFAVTLPGRGGWLTRMARFVGPVRREHIAGGYFRLTADMEINGSRVEPQPHPVLLLHFDGNFVDATGITTFSPAGTYSFVAGETGFGQAVSATSNGRAAGTSSRSLAIGTEKFTIEGRSLFAEGQGGGYAIGKNYWASSPGGGLFKVDWAVGIAPDGISLNWTDQVDSAGVSFAPIYGEEFAWSITDDNEWMYFHINGDLIGPPLPSAAMAEVTPPVTAGSSISVLNILQGFSGSSPDWANTFYVGRLDELRMHIGFALYGADNYTPATAPFGV